jgi:hypothetical protein
MTTKGSGADRRARAAAMIGLLCLAAGCGETNRDVEPPPEVTVATTVGVAWYLSRARAERRWRAAVARPSSWAASPRSSSGGASGP